eukprot:Hpha_TRINITY_DN15391_c5_g4::TRINITY_DN15391_c5_g4_i1::g.90883::m.90883/K15078/SLX1; structure-specific endonuclease subunit SLX1
MADELDTGFYAVYCLESLSTATPAHKGHSYIGFTINPARRIRQHNGEIQNGAKYTKRRRPWRMLYCIHGFTSKVLALQFEWAWQHPNRSKVIREEWERSIKGRSGCGRPFSVHQKFALMLLLVRVQPFAGAKLTIQVLEDRGFDALLAHFGFEDTGNGIHKATTMSQRSAFRAPLPDLPPEVRIVRGGWSNLEAVRGECRNVDEEDDEEEREDDEDDDEDEEEEGGDLDREGAPRPRESEGLVAAPSQRPFCDPSRCALCQKGVDLDYRMSCTTPRCGMMCHPRCLAGHFYRSTEERNDYGAGWLVPRTPAPCPYCSNALQWPALVHRSKEQARKRKREQAAETQRMLKETRRRLREEERAAAVALSQAGGAPPLSQQPPALSQEPPLGWSPEPGGPGRNLAPAPVPAPVPRRRARGKGGGRSAAAAAPADRGVNDDDLLRAIEASLA